ARYNSASSFTSKGFPRHHLRGRPLVGGILRPPLEVMQHVPVREKTAQLAGRGMFVRCGLTRLRKMHDDDGDSARPKAIANRWNQAALQVVALQDQVPVAAVNREIVTLEIGDLSSDFETLGSLIQNIDRGWRSIDSGHSPAVLGEPDRIASRAARDIEGSARTELFGSSDHEPCRRRDQILRPL